MAMHNVPLSIDKLRDIDSVITNKAHLALEKDTRVFPYQDLFKQLVATARAPSLPALHRIKAYDVLCTFLERSSRAGGVNTSGAFDHENISRQVLDLYLERHDSLKAKHVKHLLNVLLQVLRPKADTNNILSPRHLTTKILIEVVLSRDHVKIKPALVALTLFLTKDLVTAENVRTLAEVVDLPKPDRVTSEWLLSHIATFVDRQETRLAASNLFIAYLDSLEKLDIDLANSRTPIWTEPVLTNINGGLTDLFSWRNYVFPKLFLRNRYQYWYFVECLSAENANANSERFSVTSTEVLCCALQVGVQIGIAVVEDKKRAKVVAHGVGTESENCMRSSKRFALSFVDGIVLILSKEIGRNILTQQAREARIAGLSLIISSPKRTKLFAPGALRCLKDHFFQMFSDADVGFRAEVLSLMKNFSSRLRTATASSVKDTRLDFQEKQVQNMCPVPHRTLSEIQTHILVLEQLLAIVRGLLSPSSTYQNHTTALRYLYILVRSGLDARVPKRYLSSQFNYELSWPVHLPILDTSLVRCLLDLLLDSFDDVRHFASTILDLAAALLVTVPPDRTWIVQRVASDNICIKSSQSFSKQSMLPTPVIPLKTMQQKMLSSGRADHADGAARAYSLVMGQLSISNQRSEIRSETQKYIGSNKANEKAETDVLETILGSLKTSIQVAQSNLEAAVEKHPMHGHFLSLRYCLGASGIGGEGSSEPFLCVLPEILEIIHTSWHCIRPILCDDAPEGFVFEDYDEEASVDSKDILSWAWRGLKEASLLMREVINLVTQTKGISNNNVSNPATSLGNLSLIQLAELRHRGASSTVAQTFTIICRIYQVSKVESLRKLLGVWYSRAIELVEQSGSTITRRSAGIPAIFVGLLAASSDSELFLHAFKQLRQICVRPSQHQEITNVDLPQVHALNCLRAIFTNTQLSTRTEDMVVPAMRIAAHCLSSKVWSIRNCGLMLIRSLVNRLLGSHEIDTDTTIHLSKPFRLSYERFPGLMELVIDNIQGTSNERAVNDTEAYFPFLDLLRRASPPREQQHKVAPLVLTAASSPHWHVRTIACRAYASLVDPQDYPADVFSSLIIPLSSQNDQMHGRLMCALAVSERFLSTFRTSFSNVSHQSRAVHSESIASATVWVTKNLILVASLLVETTRHLALFATCLDIVNLYSDFLLSQVSLGYIQHTDIPRAYEVLTGIQEIPTSSYLARTTQPRSGEHLLARACLKNHITHMLLTHHMDRKRVVPLMDRASSIAKTLAEAQPRVAAQVLRSLSTTVRQSGEDLKLIYINALAAILQFDVHESLRIDIYREIAEFLAEALKIAGASSPLLLTLRDMDIDRPIWRGKSPTALESTLPISGFVLASRFDLVFSTRALLFEQVLSEAKSWLKAIVTCLDETNEFPLRHAAIASIQGFIQILSLTESGSKLRNSLEFDMLFVLYDAMNDDDDDIRTLAGESTASFLRAMGTKGAVPRPVPIKAQQMLAKHLVKHHACSAEAIALGIARLTGDNGFTSVYSQLKNALKEDDELFVVEKQNLYLNPAHEAWFWTRALRHIEPRFLPRSTMHALIQWVLNGITALREHTTENHDGALGWTSKPDVFVIGMRVIYATDLLIHWRRRHHGTVSCKASTLHRGLREWADVGAERELHPLWMDEIEKTLARSVEKKLVLMATLLSQLPLHTC